MFVFSRKTIEHAGRKVSWNTRRTGWVVVDVYRDGLTWNAFSEGVESANNIIVSSVGDIIDDNWRTREMTNSGQARRKLFGNDIGKHVFVRWTSSPIEGDASLSSQE